MRTFLIAPVRGKPDNTFAEVVRGLEHGGFEVYWPARDTDQNDPTGLKICSENAAAIAAADVVHVIWDGQSQGCLFDLGVAFALKKRMIALDLPTETVGRSFQNMIRLWERTQRAPDAEGYPITAALSRSGEP
jgi:nucleoside 2-deoxyribosyltransferase